MTEKKNLFAYHSEKPIEALNPILIINVPQIA